VISARRPIRSSWPRAQALQPCPQSLPGKTALRFACPMSRRILRKYAKQPSAPYLAPTSARGLQCRATRVTCSRTAIGKARHGITIGMADHCTRPHPDLPPKKREATVPSSFSLMAAATLKPRQREVPNQRFLADNRRVSRPDNLESGSGPPGLEADRNVSMVGFAGFRGWSACALSTMPVEGSYTLAHPHRVSRRFAGRNFPPRTPRWLPFPPQPSPIRGNTRSLSEPCRQIFSPLASR